MVAPKGRRRVFNSYFKVTESVVKSKITMRDELMLRTSCPFAEKEKRNTSPWGNAVDELIELEIKRTRVRRGRRNTSKAFRLISSRNRRLRVDRLSVSVSLDVGVAPRAQAKEGQRDN